MLVNHSPMLVFYINNPNVGKQTSNIGNLYLLSQCWHAILITPMLENRPPILVVYTYYPNIG